MNIEIHERISEEEAAICARYREGGRTEWLAPHEHVRAAHDEAAEIARKTQEWETRQ